MTIYVTYFYRLEQHNKMQMKLRPYICMDVIYSTKNALGIFEECIVGRKQKKKKREG